MARARGAVVAGVDLTPELLAVARRRAADADYSDITWIEGDAENLPLPDGGFDVVVSSCGLMFAPDQQKAANEVARVTSKDGRIAIRSEEHTSELQSHSDLVCRLLLEKKKKATCKTFDMGHAA